MQLSRNLNTARNISFISQLPFNIKSGWIITKSPVVLQTNWVFSFLSIFFLSYHCMFHIIEKQSFPASHTEQERKKPVHFATRPISQKSISMNFYRKLKKRRIVVACNFQCISGLISIAYITVILEMLLTSCIWLSSQKGGIFIGG